MSTFNGQGDPTTYSNGLASSAFTFDPEDRLTGIGSPSFSALYDGDGLRAMKRGVPAGTSTAVVTYFLNGADGQPVVEEQYNAGTGATTVSAANGWGADGLRARYQSGDGFA